MAHVEIKWKTKGKLVREHSGYPEGKSTPDARTNIPDRRSSVVDRVSTDERQQESSEDYTSTHACPSCGKDTSDLRIKIVGTVLCKDCTVQKPRPRGVMVFGHKTAGTLAIAETDEEFKRLRRRR